MNKTVDPTQFKYFLYARKSSESEDRQAHSVEDQLLECYDMAERVKLTIVEEFTETRSASKLGRPVFAEMIQRLEAGEADAIVSWEPHRLARNAVDGGYIIHLLDTGVLKHLVFPNYHFVNNSHGIHSLYMAFAQSKYYSDNLRENVRRGVKRKLERGEYPGGRKLGYYCHPKSRLMLPDTDTFSLVQRMFRLYLTDQYSLQKLSRTMYKQGLTNHKGNPIPNSHMNLILTDPFYYGVFTWCGETYEGVHKQAISKAEWDKVQRILVKRSRPKSKFKQRFPFTALMHCAECGMSITAEERHKTCKNGNRHSWIYYRCTKKKLTHTCSQPYVRQRDLVSQFMDMLGRVALPDSMAIPMLEQIEKWSAESKSLSARQTAEVAQKLKKITAKLRRLTDLYLEEEIDRAEYTARKGGLVNEKIALTERRRQIARKGANVWLEPLRSLINAVWERNLPTAEGDLTELRNLVAEVGSNLELNSRKLLWNWTQPFPLLAERDESQSWWAQQDSNL